MDGPLVAVIVASWDRGICFCPPESDTRQLQCPHVRPEITQVATFTGYRSAPLPWWSVVPAMAFSITAWASSTLKHSGPVVPCPNRNREITACSALRKDAPGPSHRRENAFDRHPISSIVSRSAPEILSPTGVRKPVLSMSIGLDGMVQGIRQPWKAQSFIHFLDQLLWAYVPASLAEYRPGPFRSPGRVQVFVFRHSDFGLRVITVSSMRGVQGRSRSQPGQPASTDPLPGTV